LLVRFGRTGRLLTDDGAGMWHAAQEITPDGHHGLVVRSWRVPTIPVAEERVTPTAEIMASMAVKKAAFIRRSENFISVLLSCYSGVGSHGRVVIPIGKNTRRLRKKQLLYNYLFFIKPLC
jgi:hypothetical protein